MTGKIIKLLDHLGFIEYDIDKRISFKRDDENIDVGDIVDFDIIVKKVNNSNTTYKQAKIIRIISKHQGKKKTQRLYKIAKEFNISVLEMYPYGHEHPGLFDFLVSG